MPRFLVAFCSAGLALALPALAQDDEFPPFDQVAQEYEPVSTGHEGPGWWRVWKRDRDAQLLAELPADFDGQRFFLTGTIAAGVDEVGVYPQYTMWGGNAERYVYWSRFDKSLALIEPNTFVKSSGDEQSQAAAARVHTDRVAAQVQILCMGPGGGPVIDLDEFLYSQSGDMFGYLAMGMNPSLARLDKVKAFPLNTEVAITLPVMDGRFATLHYSASRVEGDADYQPREADRRVGFFYTFHTDPAKNDGESQTRRYITRWNLQKAAPHLKLSPPVKPVVFYIEHTTPLRYRRWVRDGILEWNKAFERVGISGAIEVQIQDAASGAHMDKDPEDIRYNFIRWTNSNMGYAIGPSRAHPETGQILDADIVMDEGFVSGWASEYLTILADEAMRGYGPASLAWFDQNPDWDPRVILGTRHKAPVAPAKSAIPHTLRGRVHPLGCRCAAGKTLDVAVARALFSMRDEDEADPEEDALDGLPESFIGPLIKDVIMHEVGHTLGLMHNFKASSIYTYDQINSEEWKGRKPLAGSVMDYLPTNIAPKGTTQGDYGMIGIGPYDFWAIEWGYTSADPAEVVKRVAEPELAFRSDEGVGGSDPHAQVWDLGADNLKRAQKELELVAQIRARILDKVVKDGDSWAKSRRAYMLTFSRQFFAASSAASWIGGAHVHRDFKGDPNARDPVVPVPIAEQRKALKFVLETSFRDAAYGITPELLAKMTDDQWWDEWSWWGPAAEPDWTPNDLVLNVQRSILSRLMSPDTLQRLYDNELRFPAGDDVVTIPELLDALRAEVWAEIIKPPSGSFTARKPLASSFRRNLQREHLARLVSLATNGAWGGASGGTLEDVARQQLRDLKSILDAAPVDRADPYSRAHLNECKERVNRALDAIYVRRR